MIKKLYKEQKEKISIILPFIICALFFMALHVFMNMKIEDDYTFKDTLKDMGLIQYMYTGYFIWSSRVLINGIDIIFMALPIWIWQITDVAMILLLFYELWKICYPKNCNSELWILLGGLVSFQFTHMASAGWIATTINYLWALAIGLHCIKVLFDIQRGKDFYWYHYILMILSFFFGCSSELMAAIIFSSFVAAHFVYRKKKIIFPKWYIVGGEIASAIILVFHLVSPGEHKRMIREMEKFLPEYHTLSVLEKLRLNYIAVFEHYISKPNVLFFLLCVVLTVGVWLQCKSWKKRSIACVPLVIDSVGTWYYLILQYKGLKVDGYDTPVIFDASHSEKVEQAVMFLAFSIMIVAIVQCLYWIFEDKYIFGEMLLVLGQGFATRMVVSFSPTMFASSTRIYIYIYFAFIIVIATILHQLKDKMTKKLQGCLILIFVSGAIINVITLYHLSNTITQLYRTLGVS